MHSGIFHCVSQRHHKLFTQWMNERLKWYGVREKKNCTFLSHIYFHSFLFLINYQFMNKRNQFNRFKCIDGWIHSGHSRRLGVALNSCSSSSSSNGSQQPLALVHSVSIKMERSNLHKNQFYEHNLLSHMKLALFHLFVCLFVCSIV